MAEGSETMITRTLIKAEKLKFRYDEEGRYVFEDLNLCFRQGEMTAILGHNGCGKSTFAKHLNAILLPSGGKVYVGDIDTSDENRLYDVRRQVGMVFQNPDNQIVATIVEEDVAFALENLGVEPEEIRKRVDEALQAVGMYKYRMHSPHQLSGGQKQRVAIAGIIAMRPKCIVLDEPTAMLDPIGRKKVMDTIKKLNKQFGITVILITHYMEEAAQCGRVIVMDEGKVLLDEEPRDVFSHVELLKEVGLDVPQVTELMWELKKMGLRTDTHIIDEEECSRVLMKLLS